MSRIIFNPSTGNIESADNVTSPLKPLGERFFAGGNPLPEDPTKPVNPWAPKPIGPVLPNKMMAAKGGRVKGAGPLLLAPALAPGLAKALGITIGGLGAWAGAQKVQNYLEKNPEHAQKVWSVLDPSTAIASTLSNLLKRPKDESKEEIVERIETIKKEPNQEPPEDPWDPNKLLEILESTTYNIAESRVKRKAWNYVQQKINERAIELGKKYPHEPLKRRNILGTEFNKFLGKNIDVAGVKKDGTISYRKGWKEGNQRDTDLISVVDERETARITEEKPFRDQGYVPTKEFIKILEAKGIENSPVKGQNRTNIEKMITQFADTYNIELKPRGKSKNLGYWVKLPSEEEIDIIVKQNLPEDSKVEVIKNLIKENDLQSFSQINKALRYEGYSSSSSEFLKKHFPHLKGAHFSDKDFVYSKKVPAVISRLRKKLIENWGSPTMEKFLTSKKKAEGFGETVHLMHTEQKKKKSETPYNFADLAFGSEEENFQYNRSLDNMRTSFTRALQKIKYDYEGKNLDQEINVPYNLRQEFNFPKKMTVRKYVDRLNYMLTDLSYLTEGKVRGELLDIVGNKMKFIKNPAINYSIIPGKGMLEGQLKKYEGLFQKFKNEVIDGKNTGRLLIGEDGYPVLKKGKKLTQNQAEILMTIVEGLADQFASVEGSKPVSLETVKETFKPLAKKAEGGPVVPSVPYRENFADGTPHDDKSDEEILEWIRNQMFEMEQGWNTGKSVPGKILDVARVDNWPYYAARMLRAGMNVAEVSAKLPFVSIDLLQKLATRPAFKIKKAEPRSSASIGMGEKYMEGVDDSWLTDQPYNKLEGTGLFTEAFQNLMPGAFSEKTGLDSLIEGMEDKMIAQGQSKWPTIAGKNIEMGLDITLPFGYVMAANKYNALKKSLAPYVAGRNVDEVIEETLTDKGMNRRDFNKLLVTSGAIGALKYLGLDKLLKGAARNPIPGPIKMLERSSTKMPVWFPKFIDKVNDKMTYHGDGMWSFTGTDDFLPGFHIERIGDDYHISGKNAYEQDFQITYEAPKWEGDADGSYYNSGEFIVEDSVPVRSGPDDVDFDGEVVEELHDVLGGTKGMEEIGTGKKVDKMTKGEIQVDWAEGRAQSAYDEARDAGEFDVE